MAEQKSADGRKSRMGCVIVVAAVALILLAGYTAYRLILKARVRGELEWFAEAGYPTTLEELDAWYPTPPPGENAADVYLQAFQNQVEPQAADLAFVPLVGYAELPPPGGPLPEEMKQAIARYLEANRDALRLLHEAATFEQCRYPIDLTQGIGTDLLHVGDLRDSVQLLALEATAYAEDNNAEGSVRGIRSTLALSGSLRSEPLLISQLVRQACHRIAVDALEFALATTTFTDEQLSALSAVLATADGREPLHRAWAGELAVGSDIFGMTSEQASQWLGVPGGRPVLALYVGSGARELDHLAYLGLFRKLEGSAGRPDPEFMQAARDVQAQGKRLPFYCIMSRTMIPAVGGAAESEGSRRAEMRAAQVALAVERYRLAHGEPPDSLENLVPDYLDSVPLDPFDGKPLRYRVTDSGYVVYSIGADGVDDGGESDPSATEPPDITFTVGRPKKSDDGDNGNQPEGGGDRPVGEGRRRRRPRRPR